MTITGEARVWTATARRRGDRLQLLPDCGANLFYRGGGFPDLIAVAIGAFADPSSPADFSVWEQRKHRWVEIVGDAVEH